MTSKTLILGVVAVCALTVAGQAKTIDPDSQVFVDLGATMASGSPTGDILTATMFTFEDLITTRNHSGIFAGLGSQDFGSVSFNSSSPTSLIFSSTQFGTFVSTSITKGTGVILDGGATQPYSVMGKWTPGTFFPGLHGPFLADFTISFTQTPSHNGNISASATFTTSLESAVPEASSIEMVLTGFPAGVVMCGLGRRRRHNRQRKHYWRSMTL